MGRTTQAHWDEMGHPTDADRGPKPHAQTMTRLTRRIAASSLLAVLLVLLTSGGADARIAVNHNEN